jgi:hypothetical protein
MPDNVTANPGSGGATFASDDIGGVQFPRMKVAIGADGVNDGDVSSSNPMPVRASNGSAFLAAKALSSAPVDADVAQVVQSVIHGRSTAGGGAFVDVKVNPSGALVADVGGSQLPLPTGAATETTLAALNAKLPEPGQALMAASQPVVIASNQSAVPTIEQSTVLTGAAAQTAVVNNILGSVAGATGTACENVRAGAVQVVSTGTGGTFIFEQSIDNVNWIPLPVFNAALVTAVPITAAITATASAIIYTFPIRARFIRLRIASLITGGSIQAFSRFSTEPWTPATTLVAQGTAANLQVTADTEFAAAAALGDGVANPTTASGGALASEFNGTTWDRMRGNTAVSVEASSAKTASGNSAAALTNHSASGVVLFINVTAVTGTTPTLAVRVQMQDPVGAGWVDIPNAVTASITATGLVALAIYPGVTVAANAAVSYPLPRTWRLAWTIGGTTPSFTFSVGAQYVK